MLENEEKISEGQASFRPNRSCVDHIYTLNKIIRVRKHAVLTTRVVGKAVGNWDQRKDVENVKKMTKCAKITTSLDGQRSEYFEHLKI